MKIDPNAPAMPFQSWDYYPSQKQTHAKDFKPGLSIRAHFAAMAMAAIIAKHPPERVGVDASSEVEFEVAVGAVDYADALIAALNAEPKPTP